MKKKCPSCGKEFESTGHNKYCSQHCRTYKYHKVCEVCHKEFLAENNKTKLCSRECMSISRKNNMSDILSKMQKTCIDKYGTKNAMHNENIREKQKNTIREKYGVDNAMKSVSLKENYKKAIIEKYGVDNVAKNEDLLNKRFNTNKERYGSISPFGNKSVQKKAVRTSLQKYGFNSWKKTMSGREYSREHNPFNNQDVRDKAIATNIEKYGVPYYVMTQDYKDKQGNTISKLNRSIGELFDINESDYEFSIGCYSYDLKKDNTLIEIDPTVSHNALYSYPYFIGATSTNSPLRRTYHKDKTEVALKEGYRCIHIFDWDDLNKIKAMLKDRKTLYARNLTLKNIDKAECDSFLENNHLQGTCRGQNIRLGLYKDSELIEVMTFGKPRYNKNYEYELLRLCTSSDYKVAGGSEKLFKYFVDTYEPKSIISYCDNSKFTGNVYSRLQFNLKDKGKPSCHWYNMKTGRHITNSLLVKNGFSRLHEDYDYTTHSRGDSNEYLMIENGYLPVYDCGQSVYVWSNGQE